MSIEIQWALVILGALGDVGAVHAQVWMRGLLHDGDR